MNQKRNPSGPEQNQRDEESLNQNALKEPAEGSRENALANVDESEAQKPRPRDAGQRNSYPRTEGDEGGGITNRPLDRELQEQSEVPPRGETKDEDRNA
jgi:hypothetical protein